MTDAGSEYVIDLLAVGAGPAALVALREAQQAGLRAIAIDKGPVCGALLKHPTYMRWFSTFDKLELCGFPLLIDEKNPTRREYLRYCRAFVKYFGLDVVTYREVTRIEEADACSRSPHGTFSAGNSTGLPATWCSQRGSMTVPARWAFPAAICRK